jgi:hypothetical protein
VTLEAMIYITIIGQIMEREEVVEFAGEWE